MAVQDARQPVRPLFVSPFGTLGGAELTLLRLVARLPEPSTARAVVMTEGPLAARLRAQGVETDVIALPGRRGVLRFPAGAREVARRMRGFEPTVLHANGVKAAIFGMGLRRRLGAPLLWHKHDHTADGATAREIARRCTHVVCVTAAMRDRFGPRMRRRVSVIHPGIELPASVSAPPPGETILSAGRLDPAKGFDDLLRATAVLRDRGRDVRLVVAGGDYWAAPGHGAQLERLAAELHVADRVRLLSWVEDPSALYESARVVAVASRRTRRRSPAEAAPLVLLEGMAHARPVVGPREDGVAEIVADAGRLFAGGADALAAALEPYLADAALAERVGGAGRARAEREFTAERMAARFVELYRRLDGSR